MPKALVLGNGEVLVCLDAFGQVRDFYFPYVGHENHVGFGYIHRIGISIDDQFEWIENSSWQVSVDYASRTMCSDIRAVHSQSGIELLFTDAMYNEKNIFLRQVKVKNNSETSHKIKIFFHQQFQIYETAKRDTGYYDPEHEAIVHYEGRRVFVIGGLCQGRGFDEYSIGNYGIEGKEGTWKDAEDNHLEGNPIEHGEVDSVVCFSLEVASDDVGMIYYWVAVAKIHDEAIQLSEQVKKKTPKHIIKTTADFWTAWGRKNTIDCEGLSPDIIDFFYKSLFIIRTHTSNVGGIIASGDSDMLSFGRDTYAYVWPRDAAYTALALDVAGYPDITRKFFEFCNAVIAREGYFYQKYRSDESIGSSWLSWVDEGKKRLAIQEDETAIVLFALWRHYEKAKDLEFIEGIYNSLIKKSADFLCQFREEKTGLPEVSSDIWERIFAISTYTAASVYGGLIAASRFAELLGKKREAHKYLAVAEEIKEALFQYLYNPENGYFFTSLKVGDDGITWSTSLDSSSFFGVFLFGVLLPDDPRMVRAFEFLQKNLICPTSIGGVVRFLDDEYFRQYDDSPSNPWINITLWSAQYMLARAKVKTDLIAVRDILDWTLRYASSAGILSEQLHPDTGAQLSAAPLMYGHAEFVVTVLQYCDKYRELSK